jgi:hypothetical protein
MRTIWSRGTRAAFLAAALLVCQSGNAQAHPKLMGKWSATVVPGVVVTYDFSPGAFIGGGLWRGTFTCVMSDVPISAGPYELYMFTGALGTVTLIEQGFTSSGNIDLRARVLDYRGVEYHP